MQLKQLQLISELESSYLTPQERMHKEINIRSLKHFLFKMASLPTYEMDNFVLDLDREGSGYVKITKIQTAMTN